MAVAVARVLVSSAAFPLFNAVDEPYHYDVVVKYARGAIPRSFAPIGEEAAGVITAAASWEYLNAPMAGRAPEAVTPLWRIPEGRRAAVLKAGTARWSSVTNRESREPPAYYAVAGWWLTLGERLGQGGVRGAFWIRFLNAAVFAGILLLAAGFAAEWYPDRPLVRRGMPVLLAFMPQDIFYAINNDVPVAWWGAAAFWLATEFAARGGARPGIAVLAGGCLGFLALTKLAAAPVAAAVFLFPLAAIAWPPAGLSRARASVLAAAVACAALFPVAGWLASGPGEGALAAMRAKIVLTGIVPAPLAAVPGHPLFTPAGAWTFLRDLTTTFWRGELTWHGVRAFPRWADPVLLLVTVLGMFGALAIRPRGRMAGERRRIEGVALAVTAAAVLAPAWFSVSHDFTRSFHPSSSYPFLSNGRLALGALLPCAALVLAGLDRLGERLRAPVLGAAAVAAMVACLAAGEAAVLRMVAGSAYNWFHLP